LEALLKIFKAELARSVAFKSSVAMLLGKIHISHFLDQAISTLFVSLMAITDTPQHSSLPFQLAKVNQQWCRVVFQTPELWRFLDLHRCGGCAFASIIPYFVRYGDQLLIQHSGWDLFFSRTLIQEAILAFEARPISPYIRTPVAVQQLTVTMGLELMELVAFHHTLLSITCIKIDNIEIIFPFALVSS